MYRLNYKRAQILALVLMALCLLSLFGLYLGHGARQKIILIKRLSERDSLHFIARAGVEKALMEVSKDEAALSDNFLEGILNSEGIFKDIKVGLGKFNMCYNYKQGADSREICGVIDEARKININKADLKVLKKLFAFILDIDEARAQEFAASVIDFRDKDSALSIPLGSAENSYYKNLSEPYECKDADFDIIDELLLVKGIDDVIFDKIKNFVTIYGDGAVNINTATFNVLLSLGIKGGLVNKIMIYREGEDGILGTKDDSIFGSPQEIVPKLSQYFSLSASEVANLSNIVAAGLLGTNSDYFMIKSKTGLNYSSATKETISIVDRQGRIIFWREF